MEEIIRTFLGNIYVQLILFVLAILGVYLGIKSLRKKELSYLFRNSELITKLDIKDLEINFRMQSVQNLVMTRLAIWNSGNTTLNSSDVIKLYARRTNENIDFRILNAEVIRENEATNKVSAMINPDNDSINISFEYLDHNNGAVLQVLTTGEIDKIIIEGKIKGCRIKDRTNELNIIKYILLAIYALLIIATIFIFEKAKIIGVLQSVILFATLGLNFYSPLPKSLQQPVYKKRKNIKATSYQDDSLDNPLPKR